MWQLAADSPSWKAYSYTRGWCATKVTSRQGKIISNKINSRSLHRCLDLVNDCDQQHLEVSRAVEVTQSALQRSLWPVGWWWLVTESSPPPPTAGALSGQCPHHAQACRARSCCLIWDCLWGPNPSTRLLLSSSQRICISDRTHSIPLRLPKMCLTQPLRQRWNLQLK